MGGAHATEDESHTCKPTSPTYTSRQALLAKTCLDLRHYASRCSAFDKMPTRMVRPWAQKAKIPSDLFYTSIWVGYRLGEERCAKLWLSHIRVPFVWGSRWSNVINPLEVKH